jgi:hypothetical protein
MRFPTNGKVSPVDRAGGLGTPFPLVDCDLGPFCMDPLPQLVIPFESLLHRTNQQRT